MKSANHCRALGSESKVVLTSSRFGCSKTDKIEKIRSSVSKILRMRTISVEHNHSSVLLSLKYWAIISTRECWSKIMKLLRKNMKYYGTASAGHWDFSQLRRNKPNFKEIYLRRKGEICNLLRYWEMKYIWNQHEIKRFSIFACPLFLFQRLFFSMFSCQLVRNTIVAHTLTDVIPWDDVVWWKVCLAY